MTNKERLKIYERFFHQINAHCITMNNDKLGEAISLISRWSYSHRQGNGEFTEYEQKKLVENAINNMKGWV